ncbi:MAG: hypothetical protein P8L32_06385 [Paracoccaceae bacterium]|nr:hypothetical protein [Paracoccaceae bacterium]
MKRLLSTASALSLALAYSVAPTVALAGKGGVPNANGVANGQGSIHAHQNGKGDPQADRGNDSAPVVEEEEEEEEDLADLESDYEEVGTESVDDDVEGDEIDEY